MFSLDTKTILYWYDCDCALLLRINSITSSQLTFEAFRLHRYHQTLQQMNIPQRTTQALILLLKQNSRTEQKPRNRKLSKLLQFYEDFKEMSCVCFIKNYLCGYAKSLEFQLSNFWAPVISFWELNWRQRSKPKRVFSDVWKKIVEWKLPTSCCIQPCSQIVSKTSIKEIKICKKKKLFFWCWKAKGV